MLKKEKQLGFTLIELLVVISIIGMISSIVTTSLGNARKKARDAKRMEDIRQFSTAVQLYIDNNGHAPYVGSYNCQAGTSDPGCSLTEVDATGWSYLETELKPYMVRLPKDPCGIACKTGNRWFAYSYRPPAAVKELCDAKNGGSCSVPNSTLNSQYYIFAENMEVSSTNYVYFYRGYPTFGVISHSIGGDSF